MYMIEVLVSHLLFQQTEIRNLSITCQDIAQRMYRTLVGVQQEEQENIL
jgi:hypothetical protein